MRSPRISPDNAEELSTYYHHKRPKRWLAAMVFPLLGAALKPQIHATPEVRSTINQHLQKGGQFLIAGRHYSRWDPFLHGAMAQRLTELRPVRANLAIMTYAKLLMNPVLRTLFDNLGAIPVLREKDDRTIERAKRIATNKRMRETVILLANEGRHPVVYGEGETKGMDPEHIKKLHAGIGHVALEVNDDVNLLVLPVAHTYRNGKKRGAHVVIGEPFTADPTYRDPTLSPVENVVLQTTDALQATQNQAVALAKQAA